jgi:Putative zinc-finger
MQHLDEGTIHAWLDGELPPDEAEAAARHVAGCAECRARVVEARGLLAGASRIVSALDAGPAGVIPPAQRGPASTRRPWYRFAITPVRMSIAATILVAAGLTLTARHAADNSALRGRLIDSQINRGAQAMPASAIADSASTRAVDPAARKLKAVPQAPAPIATQKAGLSPAKPIASPVSEAAGFEAKTLQADKQAVVNSPRQIAAASSPGRAEAAPAPRPDSARAKDEMEKVAADSLRRAPALERRQAAFAAGAANQLQEAVVARRDIDLASGSVVVLRDCYRLAADSTDWRGILPSGFALVARATSADAALRAAADVAPGGGAAVAGGRGGAAPRAPQLANTGLPAAAPAPVLNSVRALDSNGRLGSAVIGSWFLVGPDTIRVRLATPDSNRAVTLLLTRSSSARVSSSDRTDSVRVARTSCPR